MSEDERDVDVESDDVPEVGVEATATCSASLALVRAYRGGQYTCACVCHLQLIPYSGACVLGRHVLRGHGSATFLLCDIQVHM